MLISLATLKYTPYKTRGVEANADNPEALRYTMPHALRERLGIKERCYMLLWMDTGDVD